MNKQILSIYTLFLLFGLIVNGMGTETAVAQPTTYFVAPAPDGNDANPGTIDEPFATITKGLESLQNGDTLNIRAGTYRLMEESDISPTLYHPGATPTNFITIQAYNDEEVKILGSLSSEGQTWTQYDANLWRLPTSFLVYHPTGMFNGTRRVEHQMVMKNGIRSHADITDLTEENYWTKADASGAGCSNSSDDHDSCYIYFYPPAGELPNDEVYEFSQRRLAFILNTSYLTLRGLEFAYTQNTAVAIEEGRGQVIENNILSHNSNSHDNAYAIFISYGGGAQVRGNTVFDSKYWGGSANSKGITFMDNDPADPAIVEENEIYNIVGGGVTVKNGVSNLIVRRNYIHHVGFGIETSGGRCHWTNPSCVPSDPEYYPGGDWKIYENVFAENDIGVLIHQFSEAGTPSNNNRIFNNVFYKNTTAGVEMPVLPSGNIIANNIFIENARGIFMNHNGGEAKTIEDFLTQFSGDHNLFFGNELAGNPSDYFLRPDWTGNSFAGIPYTLAEMQNNYDRELNGLAADPQFLDAPNLDFHLQPTSPAREEGDGTFYQTIWVDMGIYPNKPDTEDIYLPVITK